MKKLVLLLAVVSSVALFSCTGNKTAEETSVAPEVEEASAVPAEEASVAPEAPAEEAPVAETPAEPAK